MVKPTPLSLLNGHVIKLPSEVLCFYSSMWVVALKQGQRELLFAVSGKMHN